MHFVHLPVEWLIFLISRSFPMKMIIPFSSEQEGQQPPIAKGVSRDVVGPEGWEGRCS